MSGARPDRERASWRHILALAVGTLAITWVLSLTPQWRQLELRSFDLTSTLAPPQPPEWNTLFVKIDDASLAELGQWPWRRDVHARLIEQLRAAGAKAIVLDIVFAEPSAFADADNALAAAMGPEIVLAAYRVQSGDGYAAITSNILPLQSLVDRGARFGFVELPQSADGITRTLPVADAIATVGVSGEVFTQALIAGPLALEALQVATFEAPRRPGAGALIQYFGPRGTVPSYSYYQALDWRTYLPKNPFKDRIVFVGFGQDAQADIDARTADSFPTSYTNRGRGWTFGAEIHATILENLRLGLWITPLPSAVSLVVALLLAIATGLILRRFHPWRAALWVAAGLALILIASFALLQFDRLWLPPVMPVVALVLMSIGRTALGYLEERAQRQRVVAMFGHYLAPEMVERLQEDPSLLKLGGEVKELTILFCDVRGFTTISEQMQADPERLTLLVNRILTPLSNCVLAEKGAIDKYIGDCIMAFWNAPLAEPDHAVKGARAALAMIEAIVELNRQLATEGLPSIAIGIGLNTGRCVVGNMGSDQRFDYSALGDSVNLASRLESASKDLGVSIVIGPETARQIGERLPLVPLETIHVKGKQEPITVHTILPDLADRPDDLREVREIQARLSQDAPDTRALTERAVALAPVLAKYYALRHERRDA